MSETKAAFQGPLDIVRDITAHAEELDAEAREHLKVEGTEGPDELLEDFDAIVKGLIENHPLRNGNVIIYGTPVTFSTDGTRDHPAAIAPTGRGESEPVNGLYCGMMLREVYDPARDVVEQRVVHGVYTGNTDFIPDAFGNADQKHHFNYALVRGSEVIPTEPKNAHSMTDLRGDAIVGRLDEIALDEDRDLADKIEACATFTNRLVGELEHEAALNHQRVSYLNALGLLRTAAVLTNDFMIGTKASYENDSVNYFSDRSTELALLPNTFQIISGYELIEGAPLFGGPPELFVEGVLRDGQPAIAPVKGIRAYEAY